MLLVSWVSKTGWVLSLAYLVKYTILRYNSSATPANRLMTEPDSVTMFSSFELCFFLLQVQIRFDPPTFRRLREGNVFTGVCLSTGAGGYPSFWSLVLSWGNPASDPRSFPDTVTKLSMRGGNVFTGVCLSTGDGGTPVFGSWSFLGVPQYPIRGALQKGGVSQPLVG